MQGCINLARKQIYSVPGQLSCIRGWTYSQLSGLGELPLLDVDGLVEDLVPGGLGLHELEAVEVVEGAPLLGGRHPLGPRGRRPLPGDVLRLPRLAHHARPRGERELGLEKERKPSDV